MSKANKEKLIAIDGTEETVNWQDLQSNKLNKQQYMKNFSVFMLFLTLIEIALQLIFTGTSLTENSSIYSIVNINLMVMIIMTNVYNYYISLILLALNSIISIIYFKFCAISITLNSNADNVINVKEDTNIALYIIVLCLLLIKLSINMYKANTDYLQISKIKDTFKKGTELSDISTIYKVAITIIVVSIVIIEVNNNIKALTTLKIIDNKVSEINLIILICMVIQYVFPMLMVMSLMFKSVYTVNLASVYIISYITSTIIITMYYKPDMFYIINSLLGTYVIVHINQEIKEVKMKRKVRDIEDTEKLKEDLEYLNSKKK